MKFFFATIWIPYFQMWYNPKKRQITIPVDYFMNYVEDWDRLSDRQKAIQKAIWNFHFKRENK